MSRMLLYHTGYQIIQTPDIDRGRKNADLGQGFYTTPDLAFAHRWAQFRKGETVYVNAYQLETEGLDCYRFSRDQEWAEYLFGNRTGKTDRLMGVDIVMGPVANDTLFNVLGITSAQLLKKEQVLSLLQVGPLYVQTAIRTPAALTHLKWLSASVLDEKTLQMQRETLRREEESYLSDFAKEMTRLGLV